MSEIPSRQQQSPSSALKPGTPAPDFTLHSDPDKSISLNLFRGHPTIIAFYPAVDGVWCHRAFSKDRKLRFPLLSDFEPKGEVARKYGVYRKQDGTTERALFVIDSDGIIQWSYVSPIGINPGAEGILKAL